MNELQIMIDRYFETQAERQIERQIARREKQEAARQQAEDLMLALSDDERHDQAISDFEAEDFEL